MTSQEGEYDDLRAEISALRLKVDKLSLVQEIRDVLQRYARGLDRHDDEMIASSFWPDAQVNYGNFSGDRDTFIDWGNQAHETLTVRHEHHITNQTIDVSIDGQCAHVESYVIFLQRTKDENSTLVGGARYIDQMESRHGEWRIAVREFLPDMIFRANSLFSGRFAETRLPPNGEGRWDKQDLSYSRPLGRRDEPKRPVKTSPEYDNPFAVGD